MTENRDSNQPDEVIHLVLPDKGVPFARLIRAQSTFLDLIREVGRAVAGDQAVTWILTGTYEGSLDLGMQPVANRPALPAGTLPRVSSAVTDGLAALSTGSTRPEHFTDLALEKAKELAANVDNDLPRLTVTRGAIVTAVSRVIGKHAAVALGEPIITTGSVEGTLETVTVRGQRRFSISDPLTGAHIECDFGHRVSIDAIGNALEKRVAVYGDIRQREDGSIVWVRVEEMEVFPDPRTLPTADDVRGILSA